MIYLANINLNKNEIQNAVVQPLATAPTNPKLGQIYTDSVSKRIKMYDGSQWNVIGAIIEEGTSNGQIKIDGVDMTVYTLPTASATTLGGIKIGSGLVIDEDGKLSADSNVQSDWSVTDTTSDAYILNKPTHLSAFVNDGNFIDNTVSNLANYYLKSEVNKMIADLSLIDIQIVSELPETGKSNIIYLLSKSNIKTNNIYYEYLWTGTAFEKIGDTEIDLTNYLTVSGDASKTTVTFTPASTRENISTGEALEILMGKISKVVNDLKTVAFTGSYTDLSDKPVILKKEVATLSAGSTIKTITITGTQILSVVAVDAVTNEMLLLDITINGATTTVSINAAHTNDISIIVAYM